MHFHSQSSVCVIDVPQRCSKYSSLVNHVMDFHIRGKLAFNCNTSSAFITPRLHHQQDFIRNSRARSLRKSFLELTLSKAPETPELYTAILRSLVNKDFHFTTSCANASRALRSGIYANWFRPYAPEQIRCGTKREAMSSFATLLIWEVKWMPV